MTGYGTWQYVRAQLTVFEIRARHALHDVRSAVLLPAAHVAAAVAARREELQHLVALADGQVAPCLRKMRARERSRPSALEASRYG